MDFEQTQSFLLAKPMLGKKVKVTIDRQLGTKHPMWEWSYEVNYGYIEGTLAPDGKELDAYVLLVNKPVSEFNGTVVAIIHRTNNDDDKLVVIPDRESITDQQIETMTAFMEKWYKHVIVRS
jgi:inorganic pyrophosphatase